MSELIQEFASEMPDKARTLHALWQQGNRSELRRLAHQLKGAGGGYGFETLGACAARLESMLNEQSADADRVRASVEELVDMCQRVRA
ncbi:MAG: Hpt domain-containing protein [Phycisphaerales bacterium]